MGKLYQMWVIISQLFGGWIGMGFIKEIEVYRDKGNEWRWRAKGYNGRIVACSGEGYVRKQGCLKSVVKLAYQLRGKVEVNVIDE